MTKEERVLVSYRMERAKESLEEAKILFDVAHIEELIAGLADS